MITQVTISDFRDAFRSMGRGDQFTYAGLGALFEYLEQYEKDTGLAIDLDVIALCCEFSEHSTAVDCIDDKGYGFESSIGDPDAESEREQEALDYLRDRTTVIEFDGGIIIQDF